MSLAYNTDGTVKAPPPEPPDHDDRSGRIDQIACALAKAQGSMEHAAKGRQNPQLRNRYSTLADVLDTCRPHLSEQGIAIVQIPSIVGDIITVRTVLAHSSGQWMSCELSSPIGAHRGAVAPIEENRGVTRSQAIGSIVTYLRRYGLSSIASVASDDDDGAGGGNHDRQQDRESERRPDPRPAPAPEKPTTWTEDERAAWEESVAKFPEHVTAVAIDDWQQSKDKPTPAAMTPAVRAQFLSYLQSAQGLAAITAYTKGQESK